MCVWAEVGLLIREQSQYFGQLLRHKKQWMSDNLILLTATTIEKTILVVCL